MCYVTFILHRDGVMIHVLHMDNFPLNKARIKTRSTTCNWQVVRYKKLFAPAVSTLDLTIKANMTSCKKLSRTTQVTNRNHLKVPNVWASLRATHGEKSLSDVVNSALPHVNKVCENLRPRSDNWYEIKWLWTKIKTRYQVLKWVKRDYTGKTI